MQDGVWGFQGPVGVCCGGPWNCNNIIDIMILRKRISPPKTPDVFSSSSRPCPDPASDPGFAYSCSDVCFCLSTSTFLKKEGIVLILHA